MSTRPAPLRWLAALRWVLRHRAWSRYHLVRYARFAAFRLRHPEVVCEGMVFLGRRVQVEVTPGRGRIVLGALCHLGDGCSLRAHDGTIRIGEKVVMGRDDVVNCHLDVEIGAATVVADWVYVGDFDHVSDDVHLPVKDQGLVRSPVRIGPGSWLGVKSSVLRGTVLGEGTVLAAHAVARGTYPDHVVVAGIPGRVVKDLARAYDEAALRREWKAEVALAKAEGRVPVRPAGLD